MKAGAFGVAVGCCPYVDKRLRCEVKECEECEVLTVFCREGSVRLSRRSRGSGAIAAVRADHGHVQLARR